MTRVRKQQQRVRNRMGGTTLDITLEGDGSLSVDRVRSVDGRDIKLRDGKRHCEDGPAVVTPEGDRYWYRDGNLHRDDGPAVEERFPVGTTKRWYRHGVLHRDDGPAVEHWNGLCEWWLDGTKIKTEMRRSE